MATESLSHLPGHQSPRARGLRHGCGSTGEGQSVNSPSGKFFSACQSKPLSCGLISAHCLDCRGTTKKPSLCFDMPAGFTYTFLHCSFSPKRGAARRQQSNNFAANSVSSLLDLDKKRVKNIFYGRGRRTAVVRPFGYGRQYYSFERQ